MVGGGQLNTTGLFIEARTEEVGSGGGDRERGPQAPGFVIWARLGCIHSEAGSGKLNYDSSHRATPWPLLLLGSPAQPLPVSWGPLP